MVSHTAVLGPCYFHGLIQGRSMHMLLPWFHTRPFETHVISMVAHKAVRGTCYFHGLTQGRSRPMLLPWSHTRPFKAHFISMVSNDLTFFCVREQQTKCATHKTANLNPLKNYECFPLFLDISRFSMNRC